MLTAKELLLENLLKLESSRGKPAQVGYDLSVKEIHEMVRCGGVLVDRTIAPIWTKKNCKKHWIHNRQGWLLRSDTYKVIFHEGCTIPADRTAFVRQRYSLLNNGALIYSSVFDPGFTTNNLESIILTTRTLFIEENARLAQIYFHTHSPVEEEFLYDGQWQNNSK